MKQRLKEVIREELEAQGWTDKRVAELLGCSTEWSRLFRHGQIKSPNVDYMEKLYEALKGVPLLSKTKD